MSLNRYHCSNCWDHKHEELGRHYRYVYVPYDCNLFHSISFLIGRIGNVGAIDVKLTESEIKSLEEPYKPLAVFGHF